MDEIKEDVREMKEDFEDVTPSLPHSLSNHTGNLITQHHNEVVTVMAKEIEISDQILTSTPPGDFHTIASHQSQRQERERGAGTHTLTHSLTHTQEQQQQQQQQEKQQEKQKRHQRNQRQMQSRRERDMEEELQLIKAKAMHDMIEELTIRDTEKRLLFLTNKQARVFNESNIHTLINAFDLPKPQLVIKLMNSTHGCAFERWKQTVDAPVKRSALYDFKESRDSERSITLFMQEFLLPLAAANHAIIFVQLLPECTLLTCLKSALAGIRSRYGRRLPFTVIGVDTELHFHHFAKKPDGYTSEMRMQSRVWSGHMSYIDPLYEKLPLEGAAGKAWLPADVDNVILVDGIDVHGNTQVENLEAARDLEWLLLRHFAKTLPCIGIQTDMCTSSSSKLLESGIPVVYLDSRPRPLFKLATLSQRIDDAKKHFREHIERAVNVSSKKALTGESAYGSITAKNSMTTEPDTMEFFTTCSIAFFHNVLYGNGNYGRKSPAPATQEGVHNRPKEQEKDSKKYASSLFTAIHQVSPDSLSEAIEDTRDDGQVHDPSDPTPEQVKSIVDLITNAELIYHVCEATQATPKELLSKWDDGNSSLLKMLDNEGEDMAQELWREIYATLTHPKFSHGHISINPGYLRKTVERLLLSNRLPEKNPSSGLLLLREAWDTVDICNHIARKYKFLSKLLYILFLLVGVLLTFLTVFETNDFVCEDCEVTAGVTTVQALIFSLSVLASIISSVMAFVSPISRWRVLRGAAQRMESAIWQYRTRVGAYEIRTEGSHISPESELRLYISQVKDGLQEAGGLGTTAFGSSYPESVFKHGQYDDIYDKRSWLETRNLPPALRKLARGLARWVCCCARRSNMQVLAEHEDDDHHAPQTPDEYIRLRAKVMVAFYQARLPPNHRFYTTMQVVLIMASAGSAGVTFFSLTEYVAIIAIISTSVSAYMEFHSTDLKLSRYNSTIAALQNLLLWWNSLTKVEKADTRNISHLVLTSEQIHTGELESWLSKPQKSLSDAQAVTQSNMSTHNNRGGEGRSGQQARSNERGDDSGGSTNENY